MIYHFQVRENLRYLGVVKRSLSCAQGRRFTSSLLGATLGVCGNMTEQ
jgi:hypothetical protein